MILGFSHIFGESSDLKRSVAFWQQYGFVSDFRFETPVLEHQKSLLSFSDAKTNTLQTMLFKNQNLTFMNEWTDHGGLQKEKSTSPLQVFLKGENELSVNDPDGNQLRVSPLLTQACTMLVKTSDPIFCKNLFLGFGFKRTDVSEEESVLMQLDSNAQSYVFSHKLFPARSVRIIFKQNDKKYEMYLDSLGWQGISLLVRDFSKIDQEFSLQGKQSFERNGRMHQVGFLREEGVLLEFLEIKEIKSVMKDHYEQF